MALSKSHLPTFYSTVGSRGRTIDIIIIIMIIIIIIIITIIIIISIFKEDNVFSITASLPYGPPVNTDTDYYQTFFGLVY